MLLLFLVDVSSIDWSDVLISFDIDIATAHLTRKFNAVLDVHAPWVKLQQRKYFVPWISSKTKELIKEGVNKKGFQAHHKAAKS